MNIFTLMGLIGVLIGGYANMPQIHHLISEKCSAGISLRAYKLWTLSSTLLLVNAIYIGSVVFIVLGIIQLVSTFIILIFTTRNKGHFCMSHIIGKNP